MEKRTVKCRAGCNPSETRKVAGYKDDSKVMEIYNRINTHDKGALASVDDSVSHHRVTALNIAERQQKGSHAKVKKGSVTRETSFRKR